MAHKVLLVDDDNEFREVMVLALESYGYEVIEAADAKSALELLRGERPDAIISDLHMPLMDGGTFCRHVRSETELAGIPFVILSAYIESDGSNNLPQAPADCSPGFLPDCLPDRLPDYCFSKQSSVSSLLPRLEGLIVAAAERRLEFHGSGRE
ncbi:MAG TPA: response regulator [Blastocatellia bacterium]|nr:response regulator [Blastocatellia bacterium]HMV82415.1 response regulator [Blastocatellia bacterium]HMX27824.1 response regulator [Blastocatellia bacterium]HMY73612.1 response regulator [Blastocatellia bacterium]HMZ21428.1 response regulator [Blastocatellia bacterium]